MLPCIDKPFLNLRNSLKINKETTFNYQFNHN